MLTKEQIYQTLNYKGWKCTHEIKEELETENTASLEASLFAEFVQSRPEVLLPTIERYLTVFVDEKVAEARKRNQDAKQMEQCGFQPGELEYRLLPQEVKKGFGREDKPSGEYRSVA